MIAIEKKTEGKVGLVTVTPEMARLWLSNRPYHGQRPLRTMHVKFLAEEMERGNFRSTAQVVFCIDDTGKYMLVNGNHTLHAIEACGIAQTVTVSEYRVKSEEETADYYGSIDTNIARNTNDYFSAIGLREELGLTATQLNVLGGACSLISYKFRKTEKRRFHRDDHVRMIREYVVAAHEYFDIMEGVSSEIYNPAKRSATLSIALLTLRFSSQVFGKDKVIDFWKGSLFDDGIQVGDPRKLAFRHLLNVGMASGAGGRRKTQLMSPHHSAKCLASCFNAWVEKRTLKILLPPSSDSIKILGTPFTGKE